MLTLIDDELDHKACVETARLWMTIGMGEARRRRPQPRLRQRKLFRREMEDTATRIALGNPEIRQQVEALAIGQSIEFKFHNGGSGAARRTKISRGGRRLGARGSRATNHEYWCTALEGEELLERHAFGFDTTALSPPAMLRLLLLSRWPEPRDAYRPTGS
jgi:hypothetical protein